MSQTPTYVFDAHSSYVLDILFSNNGSQLISCGMDNIIKLWSVGDWKEINAIEAHEHSANSIALSPEENLLISGSSDFTIALWDFPKLSLVRRLQDRKRVVATVSFSPDGQWIAAGSYGGRAMIWSVDGDEVCGIQASKNNLGSIAFSPDRAFLATSGLGDDIEIWRVPSGEHVTTLEGHEVAVISLNFVHDGGFLISLGYEQTIKFWDTHNWGFDHQFTASYEKTRGLEISPDEQILTEITEGKVVLRRFPNGEKIGEVAIGTKAVNCVAFTEDGQLMGVGAADGKIRIWELPKLLESFGFDR